MNVETNNESRNSRVGKSAAALSTTAPARSDAGFALFVEEGMDNLFEMDEEFGTLEGTGDRNSNIRIGSRLSTLKEESSEEKETVDVDASTDLGSTTTSMHWNTDWDASSKSSRPTMSQSYAHPAASDWWYGTEDLTDSSDEENGDAFNHDDATEHKNAHEVSGPEGGQESSLPPTKKNDVLYGSSMPVAIPSMGGRHRRH